MKPDYKNWLPKGMVLTGVLITALCLILFILFGLTGLVSGTLKTVLFILFLLGTLAGLVVSIWMILMYRAFSYNGTRQMSKQIIQGIAEQVRLPEGGKGPGRGLWQRRPCHRLREAQSQGRLPGHRPLGQGICFLQQAPV